MTTQELLDGASCYQQCIPTGMQDAVIIALLNEIADGGGGGGGGLVYAVSGNYGGGQPTDLITAPTGTGIDTSNGTVWYFYSGGWH